MQGTGGSVRASRSQQGRSQLSLPYLCTGGPSPCSRWSPRERVPGLLRRAMLTLWSFMSSSWMPSIQQWWQLGQMCFLFWYLRGGRSRGFEFGMNRRIFRTSKHIAGVREGGWGDRTHPMRKERDETLKKRGFMSRGGKKEKGKRRY